MTIDMSATRRMGPGSALSPEEIGFRSLPAGQQPDWSEPALLEQVTEQLTKEPALVERDEVRVLRMLLAEAAGGKYQVVQSGDCAEDPAECTPGYLTRKAALLDALAGVMKLSTHKPVVRVGRIAGQFAKPRSSPYEEIDGVELPVFRGHIVNSPEADAESRQADPRRLLSGYWAAYDATTFLRRSAGTWTPPVDAPVWTSHEALILDYEVPQVRRQPDGELLLTSTHWPWIGERTRDLDGAHVALLSSVINPVACKVGPAMTPDDLVRLCERLDPRREPGRLALISRMGADTVFDRLPPLVAAVRTAGHPVLWLCDPMHGNTVTAPNGLKTRFVDVLIREVRQFLEAVTRGGGVTGGLHLETTPDPVQECVADRSEIHAVGPLYTSFCDPRLNPQQAIEVAAAWY